VKFTLVISSNNDAFREDPDGEVCRILEETLAAVKEGGVGGNREKTLRDINGNRCGYIKVS